jgi:hypothetical protein
MIKSADNHAAGIVATIVGVVALIVTATGVFGEVQSSMNAIWKATPKSSTLSRLVRARLASLGLVVTCGFLLTVSLAVSAGCCGSTTRPRFFCWAPSSPAPSPNAMEATPEVAPRMKTTRHCEPANQGCAHG